MRRFAPITSLFCLVAMFFALHQDTHAQTSADVDARRAELQQQLDQLEVQIDAQQKVLDTKTGERVSLERDVSILNANITKTELSIKAQNIAIQELTSSIQDKEDAIFGLSQQLNSGLDSLGAILREKNELDTTSLVVAALSSESLSTFFSDLDSFDSINTALEAAFAKIKDTRQATQQQKDDLEAQREEETQLRQVQQLQEKQLGVQKGQKNQILTETKGQEKAYQQLITANKQTAAQIRSALFSLSGSAAIPFGKALDYANLAQQKTGIRPAFLLAIITEESNLGQNVGSGSWTADMHPTRDVPIFAKIAASLGLNPNTLPVSKKAWYGWGGAMGPAQFIPSTWVLYAGYKAPNYDYDATKDRIGKLTGNHPPSPWDPKDAFMASSLLLTDDGAGAQTRAAEFKAAMCYLAGCGKVNTKSLQFYGNDVAAIAAKIQAQIDVLNGS